MFSPHLFTHVYDIDMLILALCAEKNQWLETQTGALSANEPQAIAADHRFEIAPLPASFIHELQTHAELKVLTEQDQLHLQQILKSASVQSLPTLFTEGRSGGWLRERIKDHALEWLDTHDLIPPSMRHINRAKAARLARSINIIGDE